MVRLYLIAFLILANISISAQNVMKKVEELINKEDPGWPIVQKWISAAKNKVEVLPVDQKRASDALYKTQVSTYSPMGSIIFMTGGLMIDDGWIRILGSGHPRFNRSLPDWNKGKTFGEFGQTPDYLLIADDVLGGFFLLNGGGLGEDFGKVYYFSPDNLNHEPLGLTYSAFINFCFNTDLEEFYKGYRWTNWRSEVSKLLGDQVYNFYPFLWTKEGKDINKNYRKVISVEEQYRFNLDARRQLGIDQ